MNVERLRAIGPLPVPPLAPEVDDLRRRFDPAYDALRAVALGEQSAYATRTSRGSLRGRHAGAEASPTCGDCGALRSPLASEPCRACGSAQPPDLRRMNPRAARMIGQGSYR